MLSSPIQTLSHQLARLDAYEMTRHVAPLRRVGLPVVGTTLGAAATIYDVTQAPTPEMKRKALIRDGLVLAGVFGTTALLALFTTRRKVFSQRLAQTIEKRIEPFIPAGWRQSGQPILEKPLTKTETLSARQWINRLNNESHHSSAAGEETLHAMAANPFSRVVRLFQPDSHQHGWAGAIDLSILSAIPIFLGGLPLGILADWINGENVGKTSAMKLKEGLFQFLGNITMCTLSIAALAHGGKVLGERLGQTKALAPAITQWSRSTLNKLMNRSVTDLRRLPTEVTTAVEHILLEYGNHPAQQLQKLETYLQSSFGDRWFKNGLKQQWNGDLLPRLQGLKGKGASYRKQVREIVHPFVAQSMTPDLAAVAAQPEALDALGIIRAGIVGKTIGTVAGVITGVLAGAWVSNRLNEALTNWLDLPQGHTVQGLFKPHNHSQTTQQPGSASNNGWLAGTIGERGIHWFDWVLHLDDWPSALYLAGVGAVESLVQVLYGMSAFLTGTAGTDYQTPLKSPTSQQRQRPLFPISSTQTSLFDTHFRQPTRPFSRSTHRNR